MKNGAFNRYEEALAFLYQQLPMYQRIGGKAFKPGFDNILRFLVELGMPQKQFPSIHIAGTNGKGSTSHMIASVLQEGGRRVGLYTSPHYVDFRERIKINGRLIPEAEVLGFVNQYRAEIDTIQPSYFEMTVALAFYYFAQQAVDVAVIETGLGGRLDSTNVLSPELSVITNISFDHQKVLGDTLPQIAGEKAGIIKPQVPVVVGERHPETAAVFEAKASLENAPLIFADDHWEIKKIRTEKGKLWVTVSKEGKLVYEKLTLDTAGDYQLYNLRTTLAAVDILADNFSISDAQVLSGLAKLKTNTYFIGRWQYLKEQPLIIADSGHNEAGVQFAVAQIGSYAYKNLRMIIGFSRDKEQDKLLRLLPKEATYYFTRPNVPKGLAIELLYISAKEAGLSGRLFPNVEKAIEAALSDADQEDLVFVGGSTFMVADALAYFQEKEISEQ